MSIWTEPSPSDFERWEEKLEAGEEPSSAAKDLGFSGSSAFKRADPDRHAAALQLSREARFGIVDERMEKWAVEKDAPPQMRLAWARRWNRQYAERAELEVSGNADKPLVFDLDPVKLAAANEILRRATGDDQDASA